MPGTSVMRQGTQRLKSLGWWINYQWTCQIQDTVYPALEFWQWPTFNKVTTVLFSNAWPRIFMVWFTPEVQGSCTNVCISSFFFSMKLVRLNSILNNELWITPETHRNNKTFDRCMLLLSSNLRRSSFKLVGSFSSDDRNGNENAINKEFDWLSKEK